MLAPHLIRARLCISLLALGVHCECAAKDPWPSGGFRWLASGPLVSPAQRDSDPCHAIKDPTVVFHGGKWHVFATIRSQKRTHQIEYLNFADWASADKAERHVLTISDGYFCAPQVFYFTPHKKWYLLFQTSDKTRKPELQPAFSTNESLADPAGWSKPVLLFDKEPKIDRWIDFWIICDKTKAHLFFTSLDGKMWRSDTPLANFPRGWKQPEVALEGDIFEASHTYKLKGRDEYLTIIEAQGPGGIRYYKAYTADQLDGKWQALAASLDKSFALASKTKFRGDMWTTSISHGELLRSGSDERLEVDPARLKFLFQGVSDQARAGKGYGKIPWRLGVLELAP
ncbi:MAG: non-reducing end alpha-L-arabinofuranosidase family hydrolase [Pirellulaceae bacterium]